jgi:hypothetical protein
MQNEMKPNQWHGVVAPPSAPADWTLGAPWAPSEPGDASPVPAPAPPPPPNPGPGPEGPADEDAPVVRVVELTQAEIDRLWDDERFAPPTDPDPFVRAQKVVIAYCAYHGSTVRRTTYTLAHAYREARKVARPLAALGARVPLSGEELAEYAYFIYDALASWAPVEDAALHAIAGVFQAYGLPLENVSYEHVED